MKFTIILLCFVLSFQLKAQSLIGVVQDENLKPIVGSMLVWQRTNLYSITDQEGKFEIPKMKYYNQLIISAIGYISDTINVKSLDKIAITLKQKTLKQINVVVRKDEAINLNTKLVDMIDKGELCKLACCNLSESFENSNTVDIVYSDGITGSKEIQMLGLSGSYTQILFENTPYIRGISQKIGLEQVPGTWIEGISINKGAGSVINGYESMAGQINIEVKKPRKSDRAFFNLFLSEIGKTDINLDISKRINDDWASHLFLHTNFQPKKMDYFKDGFLDMPLNQNYNIFNRWQYSGSNKFAAQFGFQSTYDVKRGGQISTIKDSVFANPYLVNIKSWLNSIYAKTGFTLKEKDESIGITYRLNLHQQIGDIGNRDLKMTEVFANINGIYQRHFFQDLNHFTKLGGSYQLDIQNEKLDSIKFDKNESVPGIFIEHSYTIDTTFSIVGGLRADFHNRWGTFITPRATVKFTPFPQWTVRVSAGKGYRTVSLITENLGWMISSRAISIKESLKPEVSWNYGIDVQHNFNIGKISTNFIVSYFSTQFQNQIISDVETNGFLNFYNLNGKSYSNSFQIDNKWIFSKNFDIKISYKNDRVKITYEDGITRDKPLINLQKWLFNPAFSTNNQKWKLSSTILINGPGRIPYKNHPDGEFSPTYFILHGLITYAASKDIDIYFGGENLGNFRQHQLIIDPENPFGNNFDASMIWGTTDGRRMYAGMRWRFPYKN